VQSSLERRAGDRLASSVAVSALPWCGRTRRAGAEKFIAELEKTQPGQQRDLLERKLRQLETASHIDEWLTSPGLQSPEAKVIHPQARDNYRVILKDDGLEVEVGPIGIQHGAPTRAGYARCIPSRSPPDRTKLLQTKRKGSQ
jgi:hypothetical protein